MRERFFLGNGVEIEQDSSKRQTPGSVSFVPPVAGLILASEVIKDLSGQYWPKNQ